MNFTFEALRAAANSVQRLQDFVYELAHSPKGPSSGMGEKVAEGILTEFEEAMDDDLNVSKALAGVFEGIRQAHKSALTSGDAVPLRTALQRIDSVLGVLDWTCAQQDELEPELRDLIEQRQEARRRRDFARADALRETLRERGILLEDAPDGVRWKRISHE